MTLAADDCTAPNRVCLSGEAVADVVFSRNLDTVETTCNPQTQILAYRGEDKG